MKNFQCIEANKWIRSRKRKCKVLQKQIKTKLQRVKENSKSYKEQLKKLLINIEGAFDSQC